MYAGAMVSRYRGSVARATLVVKPTSQFYCSVIRMDGETLQGNMGFTPPPSSQGKDSVSKALF